MIKKLLVAGAISCLFLTACSSQKAEEKANQETSSSINDQQTVEASSINNKTDAIEMDRKLIEELKSKVEAIGSKVNETKATGTIETKKTLYLSIEKEIDQIDHVIDSYEDSIETAFKAEKMNSDQYNTFKSELNTLEDQLDQSEDSLEIKFNMED